MPAPLTSCHLTPHTMSLEQTVHLDDIRTAALRLAASTQLTGVCSKPDRASGGHLPSVAGQSGRGRGGEVLVTELLPRRTGKRDVAAFAPPTLDVQLDLPQRVVIARGELEGANSGVLADVMDMLIAINPGDSAVDIGGLTFIDASGLGCIVGFSDQLTALGLKMTLTGATPRLRRLFTIVGLSDLLDPT